MFLIILGVVVLIAGIMIKRSPEPAGKFGGIVSIIGIAVAAIGLVFSVFKVIDPGKVGVQVLLAKYRVMY